MGVHPGLIRGNKRRERILAFIREYQSSRGYPPSVREIAQAVGLRSVATVHTHLRKLEAEGLVSRATRSSRALRLPEELPGRAIAPVLGFVGAGEGVLAEQNVEGYLPVPAELGGREGLFWLKVRGDSMVEAGIFDGDYVLVDPSKPAYVGDVVVASVRDEEATVKVLGQTNNGVASLLPCNSAYQPIRVHISELRIHGRVLIVLRDLEKAPGAQTAFSRWGQT